ncbi:hypothetical protein LZ30DRAFT_689508 [Colletotrichum cereale]|nr:hypothetical protein LZ30DRAFT_689508 [Colletotrichum cereale]
MCPLPGTRSLFPFLTHSQQAPNNRPATSRAGRHGAQQSRNDATSTHISSLALGLAGVLDILGTAGCGNVSDSQKTTHAKPSTLSSPKWVHDFVTIVFYVCALHETNISTTGATQPADEPFSRTPRSYDQNPGQAYEGCGEHESDMSPGSEREKKIRARNRAAAKRCRVKARQQQLDLVFMEEQVTENRVYHEAGVETPRD